MKIFNYLKSFNIIGIILWLLLAVVIYFLLKSFWRFLSRFLGFGNPITILSEQDKKEVSNQSGQFMSNGNYTYRSGAAFLFQGMYSDNPLGWWKISDKVSIGNFMLSVTPSEYILLSNVYKLHKDDVGTWILWSKLGTLSDDLRDLFSASEETKYLSHLKSVM